MFFLRSENPDKGGNIHSSETAAVFDPILVFTFYPFQVFQLPTLESYGHETFPETNNGSF